MYSFNAQGKRILKFTYSNKLNVFFHNLRGYDGHFTGKCMGSSHTKFTYEKKLNVFFYNLRG